MVKVCSKCNESKNLDEFHHQADGRLGRKYCCKSCSKLANAEYVKLNEGTRRASCAAYYKNHKNSMKKQSADWRQSNPGRSNAIKAKYKAARKKATPPWLSREQLAQISWFYETAKDLEWLANQPLHVDHIEPLQGKNSCGLHVPWNLQILSESENCSKSNRMQ